MHVDRAFGLISKAIDSGRPANGYLVCGDLDGSCAELARKILLKLFPEGRDQIENGVHPDVAWLEPQGKSRTIKIKRGKDDDGPGMRDGLLDKMSGTSYSGGWKAGVVSGADRMQEEASNAFLKLLEEPPPKTLFLLLTDAPEAILPTIASRSQRIDLDSASGLLEGELYDSVRGIFKGAAPQGVFERNAAGGRLAAILDEAKSQGDAATMRKAFFRTVLSFLRGWMVRGEVPAYLAYRNIEACEIAYRQSAKSMNDESVLSLMMDRISFP